MKSTDNNYHEQSPLLLLFRSFIATNNLKRTNISQVAYGLNILVFQDSLTSELFSFNGFPIDNPIMQKVGKLTNIKKIVCGDSHCIVSCGSSAAHHSVCQLFGFGSNKYGELGQGMQAKQFYDTLQPIIIPQYTNCLSDGDKDAAECSNSDIIDIACGSNHSVVITAPYGLVYTFGCGAYYRLGHGDTENRCSPTLVQSLQGVGVFGSDGSTSGCVLCSAGIWHTVVVADGGDVYGWGWDKFGQMSDIQQQKRDMGGDEGSASRDCSVAKRSNSSSNNINRSEELVTLPIRISQLDEILDAEADIFASAEIHNHPVTAATAATTTTADINSVKSSGGGVIVKIECGPRHTAIYTSSSNTIVMGDISTMSTYS